MWQLLIGLMCVSIKIMDRSTIVTPHPNVWQIFKHVTII
jgi:hypothetical protein